MDIPFPDIHPRVGVRELHVDPGEYPLRPSADFAPAAYGAVVYWSRSLNPWLTVEADTGGPASRFRSEPQDLLETLTRHKALHTALAQEVLRDEPAPSWVWENGFLVGSVTSPALVRVRLRVNTNHESFVRFLDTATAEEKCLTLTLVYFDGSAPAPDGHEIRVVLHPGTPVRMARTLLGLDIGNTNTTAALLDPFDRDDEAGPLTRRIPMLTARANPALGGSLGAADPRGQPIVSELRFDLFRSWVGEAAPAQPTRRFPDLAQYPDDDRPNAVDFVLGELARAPGAPARSVVIGAKRMGSIRPLPRQPDKAGAQFPTHAVAATHRVIPDQPADPRSPAPKPRDAQAVIDLDVRAPLELLAYRVFQHFREAQRKWPAKIALTYPTTYSRYELQSLRRAVQRGWLRMQAARQTPGLDPPSGERELVECVRSLQSVVKGSLGLDTQANDPVIQLLLDEASAAAFFHLYRKIFEGTDGGLAAFRYLYENGLNMLLYDCGGGTTDIALVRALVEPDVRTLKITVLRRSGVRTFGGDDITRQVCRLLKAKIAHTLAAERRRPATTPPPILPSPPNVPAKPPADREGWKKLSAEIEKFITEMAAYDPSDQFVPTRTLPNQQPTEERRAASLSLWRLGEQLKQWLSADTPPPGVPAGSFTPGEVRLPPLERETNALTRAILSGEAAQVAQQKKKLETITITRTEIDALVYDRVMRSIANCNELIRREFDGTGGDDSVPQEVHWVVVSGNAVRYPLLQKLLRQHLAVAFLDDDKRFTFDPDNAKDATAKGAVLALAAMEAKGEQIDPRFDSDLADRLPYNVGFLNRTVGKVKMLYEEHTHYRALKEREPIKIPLAEGTGGVTGAQFTLLRQFPGDPDFHKFLAFEFPTGIKGLALAISYDDTSEFEFRVVDGEGNEGNPIDLTVGDIYVAPALRGDI